MDINCTPEEFKKLIGVSSLEHQENKPLSRRGFSEIIEDALKLTKNSGITAAEMKSYRHLNE